MGRIVSPSDAYVEVLTPSTLGHDCIWRQDLQKGKVSYKLK